MRAHEMYGTDPVLEQKGIVVDYGDYRVTLARAGGANKKFARVLEAKTKPYRRAIQTETMDLEKAQDILRETYAEACILKWEVRRDDKWHSGLDDLNGDDKPVPFSRGNVLAHLKALPDLFDDLQQQAGKIALYRRTVLEADAGN